MDQTLSANRLLFIEERGRSGLLSNRIFDFHSSIQEYLPKTRMTNKSRRVRKAVLPAAGLGTRFLPATKAQPKEMLPVVDKPLIQYVVEECLASGIENIIIVTGRGKNAIEDHFDNSPELERFLQNKGKTEQVEMVRSISNMVHFSYTRQKEPLGLG